MDESMTPKFIVQALRARLLYFYAKSLGDATVTVSYRKLDKLWSLPSGTRQTKKVAQDAATDLEGKCSIRILATGVRVSFVDAGDVAPKVRQVLEYWKEKTEQPKARLLPERRACVAARMRQGFTVEDLCKAVDGLASSDFHMGRNDPTKVHNDIRLVCRNGSNVERFMAMADNGGKPKAQGAGRDLRAGWDQ